MTTLIKLFYAAAVAALAVLVVAFGARTLYPGPEEPRYPVTPVFPRPIEPGAPVTPPPEYTEAQERYQEEFQRYQERRVEYRRNIFLIAAVAGVLLVAGGIVLPPRVDAVRLGLVAGGVGTLLYAVIQAGDDLGDIAPAVIFAAAVIGFVLVLAAGYRWLSRLETG